MLISSIKHHSLLQASFVLLILPLLYSFKTMTSAGIGDASISRHKIHDTPFIATLFYIHRNIDRNLVVYDANLLSNNTLNPENPVRVYWVRHTEGGIVKELSFVQRKMAYGFALKKVAGNDRAYEGTIAAFEQRKIRVTQNEQGKPIALTVINGKWQQLDRIYLQITDQRQLIPEVAYIQVFGRDRQTGATISEKIMLK